MIHHLVFSYLTIVLIAALVISFFLIRSAYKAKHEISSIISCVTFATVWMVVVVLAVNEARQYSDSPLSQHEIQKLASSVNHCTFSKILSQSARGFVITNSRVKANEAVCKDEQAERDKQRISQEQLRVLKG